MSLPAVAEDGERFGGDAGGSEAMIEFFVPYEVKPKGNSKKIVRMGRFTKLVEPPKSKANAAALTMLCAAHSPAKPLDGPVAASYRFQYAWRVQDTKRRAKGKLPTTVPKDTSPDLGNLVKQLDDVMEAGGFVANDAQIWMHSVSKVWADRPGVWVKLEAMGDVT